jgi:hypothetical protein
MIKIPPAGGLAAPITWRPWQSTGPPIVATAPLKMGPKKNGSTGAPGGNEAGRKKIALLLGRTSWNHEDPRVKTHLRPCERDKRPRTRCHCRSGVDDCRHSGRRGEARPLAGPPLAVRQGISWVEVALDVLDIEAYSSISSSQRSRKVHIPLRAKPRDCLVVRKQREEQQELLARCPATKEVVAEPSR